MRPIDADALVEAMTKFSDAMGEDMTHGIFYTHIAPTINAVPVVRCRDCIFHKEKRCTVWRERAVIVECYTDDDGYCYKGMRKEHDLNGIRTEGM